MEGLLAGSTARLVKASAAPIEIEIARLDLSYRHLRVADRSRATRILGSLSVDGQRHPVLVVPRDAQRYVLIDGYYRVAALERLARDVVIALVLSIDEPDALAHCYRMTATHHSAVEEGWLVLELLNQGRSPAEIAKALDRSTSWVSRRQGLARSLPNIVTEAVQRGVVPAHGAMKSLLPLARANQEHCSRLCERLGDTALSTRQLAALYTAWRGGDAEQRERIVNAPRLFLEAKRVVTPESPSSAASMLARELEKAHAALVRTSNCAIQTAGIDPLALSSPTVAHALARCSDAYEALVRHVEEPNA